MTTFDVGDNFTTFNPHPIRRTIGSFHVFFVIILDKGIATGFAFLLVLNDLDVLDRPKCFHFPQQLSLCYFVRHPTNKKSIVAIHSFEVPTACFLIFSILFELGF
jgi:hypothetical protein